MLYTIITLSFKSMGSDNFYFFFLSESDFFFSYASPRLHLFDLKYNKNSNIVKNDKNYIIVKNYIIITI